MFGGQELEMKTFTEARTESVTTRIPYPRHPRKYGQIFSP